MIARIVPGLQRRRALGIADGGVEIEHGVVGVAGADPFVERLTLGFAFGCPVGCALERRERRAVDLDVVGVRPLDQLPVCRDQIRRVW